MGQIKAFKCDCCRTVFEDEDKYNAHMNKEAALQKFHAAWPEVKDSGCCFANGDWNVQRTNEFVEQYKEAVAAIVKRHHKIEYAPFSYGWFRTLDDGESMFYRIACRTMNMCPKCFIEWGQPYYANNCKHKIIEKNKAR